MTYFEHLNEEEMKEVMKSSAGAPKKYFFENMKVGDAFKIPEGVSVQSMRCIASQRGNELGMKFRVSKPKMLVVRIK